MAIELEWSEEALEDIESIATYIEKDSPAYAKFVYSYRLIYKIDSNRVLLVAVVHGKRLLENHEKSITKHSSE